MVDPVEYTVDKNIYLFTYGRCGKKVAALYEFKISVTKWGDGKYVVDSFYNEGDTLTAIETFYDQRSLPVIRSVAACIFGPNLLYLIPHDELPSDYISSYGEHLLDKEHVTLTPCLFDLSQKKKVTTLRIQSPLARKIQPALIVMGNKVFALSSPCPRVRCPEPCFESLVVVTHDDGDDTFNRWTPLECPPFHSSIDASLALFVMGVVVLEDEGLILVSTVNQNDAAFYFSYNIHSEKWSPVHIDQVAPNKDGFVIPSYIHENAAVVNNNIYTYYYDFEMLLVLPYTTTGGGDLSLGVISQVQGFEFKDKIVDICDYHFTRRGTVTKVDDQILCVVDNMCPSFRGVQHLCISIVQVVGDGKECTTLKSFTCTLSNGTEFHDQAIKSCFVLDETKSDHHRGKRGVLTNDTDDGASSRREPEKTF